jgi:hypothetical protein
MNWEGHRKNNLSKEGSPYFRVLKNKCEEHAYEESPSELTYIQACQNAVSFQFPIRKIGARLIFGFIRYYPIICQDGLRITTKSLIQYNAELLCN